MGGPKYMNFIAVKLQYANIYSTIQHVGLTYIHIYIYYNNIYIYIYIYLKHELDKGMRELNKYKKKKF